MALAAEVLLAAGLEAELGRGGLPVRRLVRVGAPSDDPKVALPAIAGRVAAEIEGALREGRFPVMIGDCAAAVGVAAGLAGASGGNASLVWCDAHADLNTPETSPSGYYGGMPLATVIGRGAPWWRDGAGGGLPLPEDRTALVGARERDLDSGERAVLAGGKVAFYPPSSLGDPAARAETLAKIGRLASGPKVAAGVHASAASRGGLYFHVDVDVLDPAILSSVYFPSPGGLAVADLYDVARACRIPGPVALAVTSFDPLAVRGGGWSASVVGWAAELARLLAGV